MIKKTAVLLIAIALSACSSIKSIEIPENMAKDYSDDGLVYFMPKKDFLVMITTTTGGQATKVTLGTTPSYPDLSKQYVLRYTKNLFGKNTLDVGVNEAGLLASTKSTTISNVVDVLKNLAQTAGMMSGIGIRITPGVCVSCQTPGDHIFVLEKPVHNQEICGMTIDIEQRGEPDKVVQHSKQPGEEHSGIFYRQNIPYVITAKSNGLNVASASLVFSPSESQIHFLPISRTFLSKNEADFQFVEGIPTKYKQETESEFVALSSIPAEVVGAYFSGIGKIFDSFTSKSQKETQALTESLNLELTKRKYDMCISAIKAGKEDLINKFCQ